MLTSNQKGAIAEARITAAAMELGIVVLRPMIEARRYDVVFDIGPRLLRVQCKWATKKSNVVVVGTRTCRHTPRGYVRGTYSAQEIDAVAAWCAETNECYFVPISKIDGQGYLHLRLGPTRNNQRQLVNWAADYPLGAIAQLGERLTGSQKAEGSSPSSSTFRGPFA